MNIMKDRDASRRLTLSIDSVDATSYNFITSKISDKFNLTHSSRLIIGLDEIFQDFTNQKYTIGLEWDIWLGYIIVAQDKKSEVLVNEIYDWLISEGIPEQTHFLKRFTKIFKSLIVFI